MIYRVQELGFRVSLSSGFLSDDPYNEDYSMSGSSLGLPYLAKFPIRSSKC